jgi:glycosyltransferase involved in cell wall biosynthesis
VTTLDPATPIPSPPTRAHTDRGSALFIVWGPEVNGPRTRVFAAALGIEARHVVAMRRRGWLVAPVKYAAQAAMTMWLLFRRRPDLVFVQSPPTVAVLCALLYTRIVPAGYVVDAHSDALLSPIWTRPAWLRRRLTSRAVLTIVTGDQAAEWIQQDGGRAMVVPDIPTTHPTEPVALGEGFHVAVVSSFAPDEPLEAIAAAAARMPDVTFHVTGPNARARHRLPATLPRNLELTGFLPEDTYFGLLAACHGVLCLTTRDHTMQGGACEALSVGTPLVTSRWPLLEDWFDEGTVHVDATPDDIVRGIHRLRDDHEQLAEGIRRLGRRRRRDWERSRSHLVDLMREHGVTGADNDPRG